MKVLLTRKQQAILVSDEDFRFVSQFTWCINGQGYAVSRIRGRYTYLHKLIHPTQKGFYTDHINRDRLDNQRTNLRTATPRQSAANMSSPRGSVSQYKGVIWYYPSRKWRAQVSVDGKNKHIGYFEEEHHAALAYDLFAFDLYGEFATLNFHQLSHSKNNH